MIMVYFVSSFSKQKQDCFGGYGGVGCGVMSRLDGFEYFVLGSDLLVPIIKTMAEDDSRTKSLNEEASTSSSKDGLHHRRLSEDNNNNKDEDNRNDNNHQSWLQLSIGGINKSSTEASCSNIIKHEEEPQVDPSGRGGNLIELDLLLGSSRSSSQQQGGRANLTSIFHVPELRPSPPRPINTASMFLQQGSSSASTYIPQHHQYQYPYYQQEIGWAYKHNMPPFNIASSSSSLSSASSSTPSSSSSLMPYLSRPCHQQLLYQTPTTGIDVAGPSSDFRVIDRPRRPHSGIWFMLQASLNQEKEPFLPQISKSYLRIKDGRMTIRLLMKYLVNKLRLDSESEIEIRCRGEELGPCLTLQHVRDNIWSRRDAPPTLLPHSSTSDHVMVLHYGRRSA